MVRINPTEWQLSDRQRYVQIALRVRVFNNNNENKELLFKWICRFSVVYSIGVYYKRLHYQQPRGCQHYFVSNDDDNNDVDIGENKVRRVSKNGQN